MRDRFNELRALALQLHPAAAAQMHQGEGPDPGGPPWGSPGSPPDLEEQELHGGPEEEAPGRGFLKDYFKKVDILKEALAEIGEKVDQMQELKTRVVEATNPDEEKGRQTPGYRV